MNSKKLFLELAIAAKQDKERNLFKENFLNSLEKELFVAEKIFDDISKKSTNMHSLLQINNRLSELKNKIREIKISL